MRITELFGPRFSRQRRVINIVVFVIVGVILAWLWAANQGHDTRITMLERSDCKESRLTGNPAAAKSCHDTLDRADRERPIHGVCIAFRRVNYPCPLTGEQARKLKRNIQQKGSR